MTYGIMSSRNIISCHLVMSCRHHSSQVRFHLEYSSGTAAVRGTKPLSEGHHYWEILMQSAVYGTDMMVGLGTKAVQMDKYRYGQVEVRT